MVVEELAVSAIAGAAGGAAGKFVETAWSTGEKWIHSFFQDHTLKAQNQAKRNSIDFLDKLAQNLKTIENEGKVTKQQIETAMDHPEFSVILQKAIISAAQTDNTDKHLLLARLVSERLKTPSESRLALASKIACDAISNATPNQLKLLGLIVTLGYLRPNNPPANEMNEEQRFLWSQTWWRQRLMPYKGLTFDDLDLFHLESLSCIMWVPILGKDLNRVLRLFDDKYSFDIEKFKKTDIGIELEEYWHKKGLQSVTPTSVGQLIGADVSDMLTNTRTEFTGW